MSPALDLKRLEQIRFATRELPRRIAAQWRPPDHFFQIACKIVAQRKIVSHLDGAPDRRLTGLAWQRSIAFGNHPRHRCAMIFTRAHTVNLCASVEQHLAAPGNRRSRIDDWWRLTDRIGKCQVSPPGPRLC